MTVIGYLRKTLLIFRKSIIPIVLDICAFVISIIAPVSSVEDRNGGEVEKSIYGLAIKKQTCPEPSRGISRLAPLLSCLPPRLASRDAEAGESKKGGSLEMT